MNEYNSFQNLLVICNTFPDESENYIGGIFIKDQLLNLSKFFTKIFVLVPAPLSISKVRKIPLNDYSLDNIHVHFIKYIDFPPSYFYFRDFWVRRETSKVLSFITKNNIHFELIHAHNTWRAGRIAVELKKIFKCPVVLTEHTSNVLHAAAHRCDPQFEITWKGCDAIIRVNSKDVHLFEKAHIPNERIHTIPNGFKKDLFYPMDTKTSKDRLGLPQNKKILLSVGALVPTKGYSYMIRALKEIIKVRKDVHYCIVGSGKLRKMLGKQVSETDLQNYVTFIGGKPHNEIPLWMNACDLFVLPSLKESFGVVQIEALACGKPVVATRNGGSEEVITSDDYGLLVEPANPNDLAEKILMALDQEWDREAILAYAERFTWERIAEEIICVYEDVLGKRERIQQIPIGNL